MKYAVSDIHGRSDKYESMLELINFSDEDKLFVIGDVIDRGLERIKIIRDIMSRPNVHMFIENHEFMPEMKKIGRRLFIMSKYSWEDFEKLTQFVNSSSDSKIPTDPINIERQSIIDYFINNPKELAENGIFHEMGYDEDSIVRILKGEIASTIVF